MPDPTFPQSSSEFERALEEQMPGYGAFAKATSADIGRIAKEFAEADIGMHQLVAETLFRETGGDLPVDDDRIRAAFSSLSNPS